MTSGALEIAGSMLMWHMWHVLFLTSEGLRIHELRELTGNGDIGMTLDEIVVKLHSRENYTHGLQQLNATINSGYDPRGIPFMDLWIKYKQVVSTTFLVDGQRQHCPFTCHSGQTSFCRGSSSSDYAVVTMSPWYVCGLRLFSKMPWSPGTNKFIMIMSCNWAVKRCRDTLHPWQKHRIRSKR